MNDTGLLDCLIDAGRILEAEGIRDFTRGHISVRLGSDPALFYMKPHSFGFDEITQTNVVTCDLDGQKVAGGGPRHSEVFIHSEIFRQRPDLASVIHCHSPSAVAFAATGQEMEALSQPAALFVGRLPSYTDTMDLIRTPDQGRAVAAALGPHHALLLRGHGVVVGGKTIEEAVILTLMLENACAMQLMVKAAGASIHVHSPEDVEALRIKLTKTEQYKINFNYLRRKLKER